MADLGASVIVSLAKAGYESCLCVKSNREDVARIAERLTWIIRRRTDWQHICLSNETNDTFERLRKSLENINLAIECVIKPRKTCWWLGSRIPSWLGLLNPSDQTFRRGRIGRDPRVAFDLKWKDIVDLEFH